jgi:hypothetical protein
VNINRLGRLGGLVLGAVAAVAAITWLLEHVMPPPYSGYLAVAIVGIVGTEVFKRQPRQRGLRMFRYYLRARQRGADEPGARSRLLARLYRNEAARARIGGTLEAHWQGASEKERVVGGVAALLAAAGKRLDGETLAGAYDRARDQFRIPGWEALPPEFVSVLRGQLDARERDQLDVLAERYRLFDQKFFRAPSGLAGDTAASVLDFARLLNSMGNQLRKDHPGDAERAYRLSLRLRPHENLAHAGLALLLEQTGRQREAIQEARAGLQVLEGYARRASDQAPSTEDIFPFRSPVSFREALERVVGSA